MASQAFLVGHKSFSWVRLCRLIECMVASMQAPALLKGFLGRDLLLSSSKLLSLQLCRRPGSFASILILNRRIWSWTQLMSDSTRTRGELLC